MTKKELEDWMWQWLSPFINQYKFMDEFDKKLDELDSVKADKLPISDVSVIDVEELFPMNEFDGIIMKISRDRIDAYNARQADRREGAKRVLDLISSR